MAIAADTADPPPPLPPPLLLLPPPPKKLKGGALAPFLFPGLRKESGLKSWRDGEMGSGLLGGGAAAAG